MSEKGEAVHAEVKAAGMTGNALEAIVQTARLASSASVEVYNTLTSSGVPISAAQAICASIASEVVRGMMAAALFVDRYEVVEDPSDEPRPASEAGPGRAEYDPWISPRSGGHG